MTDLREIIRTVFLRFHVVATCAALAGLAATGYIALRTPHYLASTEILLDPRGLQVVQNDVNPRTQSSELGIASVESQLRVIQSEAVLRRVVETQKLTQDPEFVAPSGIVSRVEELIFGPRPVADLSALALQQLKRRLQVYRAERSLVLVVSVWTDDPKKSASLANAIASEYLSIEASAGSETAKRAAAGLTSRLSELASAVKNAEERAETYKAEHKLIGTRLQLVTEQQLSEQTNRLVAARVRTAEERARYEQIERLLKSGADPDRMTEAVQSPTVSALRTQYADIIRRQAAAATYFGPMHPETIAIQEERTRASRLITAELRRIADALKNEYARARANEETLTRELDALKSASVTVGEASIKLRELEREVQANKTIYEAFLVRARELTEQKNLDTSNARVIATALPPDRPMGPGVLLILAAAVAAGMAVGVGLVLLQFGPQRDW